jgi:phosphoglycolate phosphatase
MNKIFFDLDGTLLDSRRRLFTLFQKLVPKSNLSIDEYWELKRNKKDHKTILVEKYNYSDDEFNQFERAFFENIELFAYLKLDTLVYNTHEVLNNLVNKNKLYIVTSRQNKSNVIIQLKNLSIYRYFADVLVTEHKCEKAELITKLQYKAEDFIVGDTGYDVLTGIKLGIHTIAVSYGFLNKQKLEDYNPEFIVNSLSEIIPIFCK